MLWFILVVVIEQLIYWGIYFPRKWRNGGNDEIDGLREYYEYLKEKNQKPNVIGRINLKRREP